MQVYIYIYLTATCFVLLIKLNNDAVLITLDDAMWPEFGPRDDYVILALHICHILPTNSNFFGPPTPPGSRGCTPCIPSLSSYKIVITNR